MVGIYSVIGWMILGALAGLTASRISKANLNFNAAVLVGLIGAFFGGWILNLLGLRYDVGGVNVLSFLTAVIGAILLLAILSLFPKVFTFLQKK